MFCVYDLASRRLFGLGKVKQKTESPTSCVWSVNPAAADCTRHSLSQQSTPAAARLSKHSFTTLISASDEVQETRKQIDTDDQI